LHEAGYRFCWPPRIDHLTPRERRLLALAEHAEAYQKQQAQKRRQEGRHGRPDNFGDVEASRQRAFQ